MPPLCPAAVSVRLAAFYGALFLVVGALLPFWPVWLAARGLTPGQIGVVVALGVMIKILGNPLAAAVADRLGERRRPIIVLAAIALITFPLFAVADSFWAIIVVTVLCWGAFPATIPLIESLTMLAVGRGFGDYGRIRVWGSIAFIVTAVGTGSLLVGRSADVVLWLVFAGLALLLAVALALPDLRPQQTLRPRLSALAVVRLPGFAVFLGAATAVQASHAVYYAFSTLHWRNAGYSEAMIGGLWAEGVIAEIALFTAGDRVARRIGPARLILLGALAGVVRWSVTGLSDALPALIAAQALHAFTFGAVHLGSIHLIAATVPPPLSATAQSLYASLVMGLGLGLMVLAAGPLYDALGGGAFLAMAGLSVAGVVLAAMLAGRMAEGEAAAGA